MALFLHLNLAVSLCALLVPHCLATGPVPGLRRITPIQAEGIGVEGYRFHSTVQETHIECAATQVQEVVPGSYLALSERLPAEPYLGQRIRLQAFVFRRTLRDNAFAALFVKVVASDGRTLAFDNMNHRRIGGFMFVGEYRSVVVDVPGLSDSCPIDGSEPAVPATIHVGWLLSGFGYAAIQQLVLDVVPKTVAITGGPPPWLGPMAGYP